MSATPTSTQARAYAVPAATWASRVALAAGDIKLHHSVFALPLAVLGAFAARPADAPWSRFTLQLGLVIVCMVAARTWAMLVNRLADAAFDAVNPRTARRAVASGRLRRRDAIVLSIFSAGVFVASCAGFFLAMGNPWPLALSLPVLGWLALYSYGKRFTAWCHVMLGLALAISPLAAALAVDPLALGRVPALYALAAMLTLWVAGFDIVYALQDVDFDRGRGLYSVPAHLGRARAVHLSRALHAGAVACLALAIALDARLRVAFPWAVGLTGGLLLVEHAVLARRGLAGLPLAFFTINGVISCVLGAAGVADVLGRA